MKTKIFPVLLLLAAVIRSFAVPVTVSQWTFETTPPPDVLNSAAQSGGAADVGNGTASGVHASAGADWSTPAGNGSANSWSSTVWGVGDYWQFRISTLGYSGLVVSFDQFSSATGPRDFTLRYSTDGSSFTTFASYSLPSVATWTSGSVNPLSTFSFNLSSITALDNASAVYLRLVDASTVSVNGGVVGTGGTDRIDNFTVKATTKSVPESLPFGTELMVLLALVMTRIVMPTVLVLQPVKVERSR